MKLVTFYMPKQKNSNHPNPKLPRVPPQEQKHRDAEFAKTKHPIIRSRPPAGSLDAGTGTALKAFRPTPPLHELQPSLSENAPVSGVFWIIIVKNCVHRCSPLLGQGPLEQVQLRQNMKNRHPPSKISVSGSLTLQVFAWGPGRKNSTKEPAQADKR